MRHISMETSITKLPKSQFEIKISVLEADLAVYLDKAAAKISEKSKIRGYRPGKAPRSLIEKEFGKMAVLKEALNDIIQKNLVDVILKEKLDAIGTPEINLVKAAPDNPVEFKAKITVLPEIELGEYKDIKINGEEIKLSIKEIEEKEIQDAVEYLQKSRAEFKDGKEIIPELTGEFAQSLGEFKTADDLKKSISNGLEQENLAKAKDEAKAQILDEIVKNSKMEIPDVLIENKLNEMKAQIKDGVEQMGMIFKDYLTRANKTLEELKKEWMPAVEKSVKSSLVLSKIAVRENIEISQEELDAETSKAIANFGFKEEEIRKKTDMEKLSNYIRQSMTNEKVLEMLEKWNVK